MRSEGFPFIVWGSGGWTLVRLELLVASSSRRRRVYGGSCETFPFLKVSKQVVMSFCVAGKCEVLCASFVVQSSAGKCIVQAL